MPAENALVIHSEDELWAALADLPDELPLGEEAPIYFEGWPKLEVRLTGDRFQNSITPTVMKAFIELQRGINRSYAQARYGSPAKKLTADERKMLEIKVVVSEGSSIFEIELDDALNKIAESLADQVTLMDPSTIALTALGIAALHYSNAAWKSYLENRRETRKDELASQDSTAAREARIAELEAQQFCSEQETQRMQLLAGVVQQQPQLAPIEEAAEESNNELLRALASAETAEVNETPLEQDMVVELKTNARKRRREEALTGVFRILAVDSANPDIFRIKIRHLEDGYTLRAVIEESAVSVEQKRIVQNCEWSKTPVFLELEVMKTDSGEITSASVIRAESPDSSRLPMSR